MKDNTNYILLLGEVYPDFRNNIHKFSAADQTEPSLQRYAQILWNVLKKHREGLADKPNLQRLIPSEQKKEKEKFLKKLDDEAKKEILPCNGILENAAKFQEGLQAAGKIPQAENSVELGLQSETRARLRAMNVPDRIAAVQSKKHNFIAFRSIENDPLFDPNFLGENGETQRILNEVRDSYVQTNFSEAWEKARTTAHNAEIAGMMRDFALQGLEQNKIQAKI